jgi:hypothetical protein
MHHHRWRIILGAFNIEARELRFVLDYRLKMSAMNQNCTWCHSQQHTAVHLASRCDRHLCSALEVVVTVRRRCSPQ